MKFPLNLLLVAAAVGCGMKANATAYEAKNVTMSTLLKNADESVFALIGETADGCQVWCGKYPFRGAYSAVWRVDARSMSAPTDAFETGTKYELDTYFAKYYNKTRQVATDSTDMYFLKVKSSASADLFAWDGTNTPDFIHEFRIEPVVTMTTGKVSNIDDGQRLKQTVAWNVAGLGEVSMDSVVIERSYDGGKTWTRTESSDKLSGSADVVLPINKDSVCYRATAYANNDYRLLIDDDRYVSEQTASTNIANTSRVIYNASSVTMTVGVWGTDISMSLLGVAYDGCQIWACNNTTGKYRYTHWTIDGNRGKLYNHNDLYTNTLYHHLIPSPGWAALRDVPDGSQYFHFIKLYDKETYDYFNWAGDTRFRPTMFYLPARMAIAPTSADATVADGNATQAVAWSMKGVNTKIIDRIVAEVSCDGGKTWREAATVAAPQGERMECGDTLAVSIPAEGTTARFRLTAYAKNEYKVVVENGLWTTESDDYPLAVAGTKCSLKATALHRDSYADNADMAKRTINADVEWTAYEDAADMFGHAEIQCSTDNGNTWTTTDTVATVKGERTVKVPVGYTRYLLRIKAHPADALDSVALLQPTAKSNALKTTYSPAITAFAASGDVKTDEYGKLATIEVSYALNDDLWQTRGMAYLSYSYDDGQTWRRTKGFNPSRQGSKTIAVEKDQGQCRLRLEVEAAIDGKTKTYELDTNDIAL